MTRALLLVVLFALAGCGSAPTARYYVLSPLEEGVKNAPPAQTRNLAVVVASVRLPQYLDRTEIVTRDGASRLQLADFAQWGGSLRQDMTRVLVGNLGQLLGSDRVVAAGSAPRAAPDYRVEVEILRFERAADGRVQLAARWWLLNGKDGAPLASPLATLAGSPLAAEGGYDAVVESMSAVYNQLAVAIADVIRSRTPG
jgi:uncharacterized lipoprotein YmbA